MKKIMICLTIVLLIGLSYLIHSNNQFNKIIDKIGYYDSIRQNLVVEENKNIDYSIIIKNDNLIKKQHNLNKKILEYIKNNEVPSEYLFTHSTPKSHSILLNSATVYLETCDGIYNFINGDPIKTSKTREISLQRFNGKWYIVEDSFFENIE